MSIEYILIVLGVILVSMTLHEAMHGYVAYFLGDDTAKLEGRLTLNPIKHIDPFLTILLPLMLAITGGPIFGAAKPVPFNPGRLNYEEWGSAMVALAGPLTNLLIAFIFFGVYALINPSKNSLIGQILNIVVNVNLGFFIFNMIPIPPLDGSRVLYAVAPDFVRRGMETLERAGLIVIFLIIILASSIIGAIMNSLIAFFIGLFSFIFGLAWQ